MAPRRALVQLVCVLALVSPSGCSIYAVLTGTVCDPTCGEDQHCEQGVCTPPLEDAENPAHRDAGMPDAQSFDAGFADAGRDAGPSGTDRPDTGLPDVPTSPDAGAPDVDLPDAALDCQIVGSNNEQLCDNPPPGSCLIGNDPAVRCADVCGALDLYCAQGTWDPNACPGFPEATTGCHPALENPALAPNWGLTCECRAGPSPLVDGCPAATGNDTACGLRTDGCAYAVSDTDCATACGALALSCLTAFENLPNDACLIDINNNSEHACSESSLTQYCLCGVPGSGS